MFRVMKNATLALFAGLTLMACAPPAPTPTPTTSDAVASTPTPETPAPPAVDPAAPPEDACGALKLASLIGKPITSEGVPPEGPAVRHIRPGTQVTMDFRPDRINIDVDANDIITGFRCT